MRHPADGALMNEHNLHHDMPLGFGNSYYILIFCEEILEVVCLIAVDHYVGLVLTTVRPLN